MANNVLTATAITREALRVLHGKLSFIGNVNRQYDDRFAKSGAKIGTSLNIRMPPKYTVRTGATASFQDHVERSTPLTVSSQAGVDVSFTSVELTMSLDEFSYVVLEPAMSQIAAHVENQCLSDAQNLVANYNGLTTTSGQIDFKTMDNMGSILTENLAPYGDRCMLLTPTSRNEIVDATKGLFQSSSNIAKQYREGMLGRTSGFDVFENTYLPAQATGTLAGSPLTTGAALGTSTTANAWVSQSEITVDGATTTTTLKQGDIITFDDLYEVHPETKVNTGKLKRFVVQQDKTITNDQTFDVKPGMIYGVGNAYQNCVLSGSANTDGLTVTKIGVAGQTYGENLAFHKDAFVFATADLVDVTEFGAWGSRQTMDGISMRLARQYDITNDAVPARFDILYGFGGLYPELAVRNRFSL